MALDPDPYHILELPRGAPLDEVKRAYRRLAKANHPDAAGEAALPRFLAIQAAYEQLITGSDPGARGRRGSAAPRRPWEADPDRSDATRRAYGGRARSAPPGGRGKAPGSGESQARGAGTQPGASGSRPTGAGAGPSGPAGGPAGPGPTRSRSGRRRTSESAPGQGTTPPNAGSSGSGKTKRNKATLGSTSYDGADGPFEPDWRGASWYGTTSGTYWTLNPREYADPRKHGPEYQARARRAARSRAPEAGADATAAGSSAEPAAEPLADAAAGPTHTTSSWWDSTTGPAAATGSDASAEGLASDGPSQSEDRRPPPTVAPPPPDLGRAIADITHALTDERFGGVRGRVARAIVGWLPIALGVGWVVGELTGCGRFAATCDGASEPFVLLLQVAALGVLLLVPALASVATMAALALFAAAVIAALILSATGSAADGDSRRAALGAVLLVAWLVGLAIAVMRRIRALPSPTRPVS
jgi:curved DNA-binding protein CbpA